MGKEEARAGEKAQGSVWPALMEVRVSFQQALTIFSHA